MSFDNTSMNDRAGVSVYSDPDAIPEYGRRWSWMEVDLDAIAHNIREYRKLVGDSVKVLAVVKANAYGHGAVRVSRCALASGASYLGVATVDEGIDLRKADIDAPILLLSEPPEDSIPLLLRYRIMPSVYTRHFADAYSRYADLFGVKGYYHLAINSGMNRIGVPYNEVVGFVRQLHNDGSLELAGVFTHFATADEKETSDFSVQEKRFIDAITDLQNAGFETGLVHAANTAAGIRFPNVRFDMVRFGISMYGLHASEQTKGLIDLRPAMSIHARITNVQTIDPGEGVSYGFAFRSNHGSVICTLPIGYADGLPRVLSNRMEVIMDGKKHHQVGSICMDQCMFEVDDGGRRLSPDEYPEIGDEVVIVGSQGDCCIALDDLAETAGTINYEIACGFDSRVPKIYPLSVE